MQIRFMLKHLALVLGTISLLSFTSGFDEMYSMTKKDKKQLKLLSANTWASIDAVKGGKKIDVNKYLGETVISFNVPKEKTALPTFNIKMGDNEKTFDFKIKNDSIQLKNANGWNDYKIKSVSKTSLILEQFSDNVLWEWNMTVK